MPRLSSQVREEGTEALAIDVADDVALLPVKEFEDEDEAPPVEADDEEEIEVDNEGDDDEPIEDDEVVLLVNVELVLAFRAK